MAVTCPRERPAISRRAFVGGALAVAYGPRMAEGQPAGKLAAIGFVSERDLPVEEADRFELVINLTAAQTLGLTIPAALRQRAETVS